MTSDTLAVLQALDVSFLTDLVRQDQRNPLFEILDWTVQPLSFEKIIATTGGLFRFSGTGKSDIGTKSWSIVLKILNQPQDSCLNPDEWCYWKREMLAFESGLLADLPTAVRAPRCYGVMERENSAWIWMEHIVETVDRRWSLDHYQRAARQMGRYAGDFLTGTALPDKAWLTHFFLSCFDEKGWWANFMNPQSPTNAWQSPLVQQAFPEPLRSGVLRIWAEKYSLYEAYEKLPQVFCHNDLHRRNLMLRTNAADADELIVLDWAFCGPGAVGSDMGELIATTLYYQDVDMAQAVDLEAAVMEGYQAGLREAGWSGDMRLARLGYLLSATFWMGATLPGWAAVMLEGTNTDAAVARFGHPVETILANWVKLCEFVHGRTDEARHLISELGLDEGG